MQYAFVGCWLLLSLVLATPALAGDGRIEINQSCAEAGCFAGDTEGFPVTISSPGSYVLTSDLVVLTADASGIFVQTGGATLDLNGFSVRGPVTCSRNNEFQYDPTLITCSGSGNGVGVYAAATSLVRNGTVSGFGSYGISAQGALIRPVTIEDVRVEQNAGGGIYLNNGTIRRATVSLNGASGIFNIAAGDASSSILIEDSTVAFNKSHGIALAGKIHNTRLSYNGGSGVVHGNAGGQNSSLTDVVIYRSTGNAINAYGSYRDCDIQGNSSAGGGQVIGSMSDEGGNHVH
jgi:hypothetical protein